MAEFLTFKGPQPWPWPWIGSYCIPSCITHRPLPTNQISLKFKKVFVDRRSYRWTYGWADALLRRTLLRWLGGVDLIRYHILSKNKDSKMHRFVKYCRFSMFRKKYPLLFSYITSSQVHQFAQQGNFRQKVRLDAQLKLWHHRIMHNDGHLCLPANLSPMECQMHISHWGIH